MSKPKKLITIFKISNNFPPYLTPLRPACNASWLVNAMDTDHRLPRKKLAKVNVNIVIICGSTWLWHLCRWHYPVLPSPFRGQARDDGAPAMSAGTMKGITW